jgi:hypothetical protein
MSFRRCESWYKFLKFSHITGGLEFQYCVHMCTTYVYYIYSNYGAWTFEDFCHGVPGALKYLEFGNGPYLIRVIREHILVIRDY